jgi:hypothetical protein
VKAVCHAELAASPVAVLARLSDPSAWPSFVGGLRIEGILPDTRLPERCEVELSFADPRPIHLRVQLARHAGGISVVLVHGDLSSVDARVEVAPRGAGSTVHARLEVLAPVPVPGVFRTELEQALLPRWLAALDAGLR